MKSNILRCALVLLLAVCATTTLAGRIEAYETHVDDQEDSLLKLDNDAVVKIRGGRSGRVSGRPDCILIKQGMRWMIWIEGKDLYDCDIEEDPRGMGDRAEEEQIMEVKYNGEVLLMEDGSIYEVETRDIRHVSRWREEGEAIFFSRSSRLLNLDQPEDVIRVRKLR
jgi:hypothetical protein